MRLEEVCNGEIKIPTKVKMHYKTRKSIERIKVKIRALWHKIKQNVSLIV